MLWRPASAHFTHTALVTSDKSSKKLTIVAKFGSEKMVDVHGSCVVDAVEWDKEKGKKNVGKMVKMKKNKKRKNRIKSKKSISCRHLNNKICIVSKWTNLNNKYQLCLLKIAATHPKRFRLKVDSKNYFPDIRVTQLILPVWVRFGWIREKEGKQSPAIFKLNVLCDIIDQNYYSYANYFLNEN
jgi:hypothetical protein